MSNEFLSLFQTLVASLTGFSDAEQDERGRSPVSTRPTAAGTHRTPSRAATSGKKAAKRFQGPSKRGRIPRANDAARILAKLAGDEDWKKAKAAVSDGTDEEEDTVSLQKVLVPLISSVLSQ